MSTQVEIPTNGPNGHSKQIPKHLRKASRLREHVFAFMDATDNADFVALHKILSRYLKEVPAVVREELDRLEYGE